MSQHAFLELTGTFLDVGILPRILFSFGTEHFILWGLRLPALYRYPPAVPLPPEQVLTSSHAS